MKKLAVVISSLILASQGINAASINGQITDSAGGPVDGIQVDAYRFNPGNGSFEYKASGTSVLAGLIAPYKIDLGTGGSVIGRYMLVANPSAQANSSSLFLNAWNEYGPFWNAQDNQYVRYPVVTYNGCTTTSCSPTLVTINRPNSTVNSRDFNLPSSSVCSVTGTKSGLGIKINGATYTSFEATKPAPTPTPVPPSGQQLDIEYFIMPTDNVMAVPVVFATNPTSKQNLILELPGKPIVSGNPDNVSQTVVIPQGIWDGAKSSTTPDSWVLNVGIQFKSVGPINQQAVCNPILFPVVNP